MSIGDPGVPVLTPQQRRFTMGAVLLGMLLAALDQTIVSTAGPVIQRELGMSAALYPWMTTAYLVASTVMIPIWGKLSDLFGRKPILNGGIALFLLGSLLCGLAPGSLALVGARGVQGLGSAALFTTAFAVIADLYPPAERGRLSGLFGAVFGLSSVIGPLIGGTITDHLGWRWVFLVNLPMGLLASGFALARMPALGGWRGGARPRIDAAGALALAVGVVPFLLALSFGRPDGPGARAGGTGAGSPVPLPLLLALSAIGLAAFVLVERRSSAPILDLRLFKNRAFAWGVATAFASGATFLGAIVFLPLFMVNVVGLSATKSGLTVMPLTLGIVAGNVASGQLTSRLGRYKVILLGSLVVQMAAFAILAFTLTSDASQAGVTIRMVLVGIGLGPAIPIITVAVQNAVAPQQIGVATSSATFFRQMGSTIGVAALGGIFATGLRDGLAAHPGAMREAFTLATRTLFEVALAMAALAFLVTLRLPELPLRRGFGPAGPAQAGGTPAGAPPALAD